LSQENPLFREEWIKYSSRDSLATWQLAHHLVAELKLRQWMTPQDGGRKQVTLPGGVKGNMYHFYKIYFRRFGELLTDMEAVGIKVDQRHLPLALSLSLPRLTRSPWLAPSPAQVDQRHLADAEERARYHFQAWCASSTSAVLTTPPAPPHTVARHRAGRSARTCRSASSSGP
jgi:hypothetical protein